MTKKTIVISGLQYAISMMSYFIRAFKRRDDVDVFLVGPFFDNWMPWTAATTRTPGIIVPQKYVVLPDIALPREAAYYHIRPEMIIDKLPKKIDLWLQIHAGWCFSTRPPGDVVALIQTDPHTNIDYSNSISYSDYSFCMQSNYMKPGDIHLPYAYDPTVHYPMDIPKEYDACLIGLLYDHRLQWIHQLIRRNLKVQYATGIIFDEYRQEYNKSRIALSWSALQDTPIRVFEALAMGIPLVCNRTPDLQMFFKEGEHYLGFEGLEDAINKVLWAHFHPEDCKAMAAKGMQAVKDHTFDNRVEFIMKTTGLL